MFNLLFLHVAFMFTAVALHAGPQLLIVLAARTDQTAAIPPIARIWLRSSKVISAAFSFGAVFGLATAIAFGFNLASGWLIAAYVLFFASGAFSFFVTIPRIRRLADDAAAIASDPLALPARALGADAARLDTSRLVPIVAMDLAFLAAIVYDMVVKPFA